MIRDINIPIICPGTVLEIPVEGIINDSGATIIDFQIVVTVPAGVTYSHSILPKGSYDSGTNTWTVGSVANGELVEGLLYFTVVNDALAPFEFSFTVGGSTVCDGYCVKVTGLTCYQLSCCDSAVLARDARVVVPKGTSLTGIDVTTTDGTCPTKTYTWLNDAGGTLTGSPDNATYTPHPDFCGTDFGEYALYCNGVLNDTARVMLSVACAAPTTQWVQSGTNTVFAGNVGVADHVCTEGAVTTWHLANSPTAQGAIVYATTSSDVTVTHWDQNTGNYQLTSINGFEGVVFFSYFIRCTINGLSWDSGDGQEVISVTAAFPPSSSIAVSSSVPASSSNQASSSMSLSSSNAASSSAPTSSSPAPSSSATSSIVPASSSATSSIVPPSSSILIPSSNPAASSSLPFSSSNLTSSSINASSSIPESSSNAADSSSQVTSSSAAPSSSTV